ncbi:hypothetical protein HanRHA438_Chr14g0671741 [Helianthus annuus]|nr:hypothetical protein HanHA300_Chr14g0538361 [Helianthus annuus]KAJ0470268.1 hypothetical protein HanIR_Chr14g0716871 [Helianthus annuus]KAJ0661164.1 hypothetical protein HanOQP8_Chr14g0545591 [Helianthus annuus]KAJ0841748.1 hypothetical protein HanPSC8_Chr14g0633891 [Helianthus annuus]KAJ0855288.1 hypothetical protein HanRHA438_Chr14g0671741 [Helianthus annuus]
MDFAANLGLELGLDQKKKKNPNDPVRDSGEDSSEDDDEGEDEVEHGHQPFTSLLMMQGPLDVELLKDD